MSIKKRILKQTLKYEKFQNYMDTMKANSMAQQDQSLVPFDLSDSVQKELLAKKEANRKARNKRKSLKNN